MERVVAVLGRGVVPAESPILRADDLGVLRGDGVFETLHVLDGRPRLLDEHLRRMAASAARMDLDLPPRGALGELAGLACAAWPDDREGALRLVCTRGPEGGGPVTAYATVFGVAPGMLLARRDGVRLATATLGFAADVRAAAPWLLGGVKTLSYAVNMATLRWAGAQGVDDVLWLSADGFVLEAPTATVLWLDGGTLCTVPASTGILPGITARHLLDHVGEVGLAADERMVRPAELADADGVWLASSVRGVVAVRQVDGARLADCPLTGRLRAVLGYS